MENFKLCQFIMILSTTLAALIAQAQTLPAQFISADQYAQKMVTAKDCQKKPVIDFSPGLRMTEGKYKGQCLDTSSKRAVVILNETSQGITFANFKHDKKFWKAHLNWSAVDSIEYVLVDLPAKIPNKIGILVSHAELRFKLKKDQPILLESLDDSHETAQIDDFIFSFNYMAPAGVPYDPVKGFDEELYQSTFQAFSMADEVRARFVLKQINVYSLQLKTSTEQNLKIIRNALWRSHQAQYSINYDTWDVNCVTELFNVIDGAIFKTYPDGVQKFTFHWYELDDTAYKPAVEALLDRQLLKKNQRLRLLNSEFGYPQFLGNDYK